MQFSHHQYALPLSLSPSRCRSTLFLVLHGFFSCYKYWIVQHIYNNNSWHFIVSLVFSALFIHKFLRLLHWITIFYPAGKWRCRKTIASKSSVLFFKEKKNDFLILVCFSSQNDIYAYLDRMMVSVAFSILFKFNGKNDIFKCIHHHSALVFFFVLFLVVVF